MGAEELKDFRPINLVGGLYKLFAKVLTNKLKSTMGKLVLDSQQAIMWTRIFHVRPHSICETRFLFVKN